MPGWVVVVFLFGSSFALHALVRLLAPGAARAWSTGWILTWVAWLVVVVPGTLVAWSRLNDASARKRLRARLDAWTRAGERPVGALASALVEAQQHALLEELLVALEPRRAAEPEVAAFVDAARRFLTAAGYGSGAFHGDGWASLGLVESFDAAKRAADALP